MLNFATILKIVQGATTAAPAFTALLDQVKTLFNDNEQTELQDAYDKARGASDAAEDDFVNAGRGD